MKTAILITALLFASTAQAQMQCQTLSDGRMICTPAGGQGSSYGR